VLFLCVLLCMNKRVDKLCFIDREFEFYEFFSFLKFNEFYEFFWLKKFTKKFVILIIIDI